MEKFLKFYSEMFKWELEYCKYTLSASENDFTIYNENWGVVFHTTKKSEFVEWLYALRVGQFNQFQTYKEEKRIEAKKKDEIKSQAWFVRGPKKWRMVDLELKKFYQAFRIA